MLFIYNICASVQITTEIKYTEGRMKFSMEEKMEHGLTEMKSKTRIGDLSAEGDESEE